MLVEALEVEHIWAINVIPKKINLRPSNLNFQKFNKKNVGKGFTEHKGAADKVESRYQKQKQFFEMCT